MNSYLKAFGNLFELGFKLSEYPFLVDQSDDNDMCPSFHFELDSTYYILWVDHCAVEKREDESNCRYTVVEAENLGDDEYPELQTKAGHALVELEAVADIVLYLNELKSRFSAVQVNH
ncbi:hypothetical protein [Shewanella sp. SW24]|uniref:hypothetical protein n=1 Tax=Shewanella sp. SW24 TaxID=2912815 RepID=UPI0021D81AF0|nr:hypothetical protein [Shewanella sp. SW24]MCU7988205.1 hypothetical protein [Shewanella sp. SW24]